MVTPRNALAFVIIRPQISKRKTQGNFSRDVVYTFIKMTYFTAYVTILTNICVIVVTSSPNHYLLMENRRNIQSANFDLVNTYFGIDVGHTYDGIDVTA